MDKKFIFIKTNPGIYKPVLINDIVLVSANGDFTNIITEDENKSVYSVRISIKNILNKLNGSFCRVHRSHIVNTSKINTIQKDTISTENYKNIPISKSFKKQLINKLNII